MKKCITHNTQTLKTVWQYPERKGAGGWWRWAQRGVGVETSIILSTIKIKLKIILKTFKGIYQSLFIRQKLLDNIERFGFFVNCSTLRPWMFIIENGIS